MDVMKHSNTIQTTEETARGRERERTPFLVRPDGAKSTGPVAFPVCPPAAFPAFAYISASMACTGTRSLHASLRTFAGRHDKNAQWCYAPSDVLTYLSRVVFARKAITVGKEQSAAVNRDWLADTQLFPAYVSAPRIAGHSMPLQKCTLRDSAVFLSLYICQSVHSVLAGRYSGACVVR